MMSTLRRLMRQKGVLWSALPLLVVGLIGSAWAGETTDRIKVELERLTATLRDPALQDAAKEDKLESMVNALIVQWFDLEEMARRSLGDHWATRSSQERKEFVELFGELLVSYTRQVTDHLGDQQLVYLSEEVDGQAATVKTKFLSKRNDATFVDFVLHRRNNGWAPCDIVIDEVSVIRTFRTQFDKTIRSQSYEALVKKMRLKRESEGLQASGLAPASPMEFP